MLLCHVADTVVSFRRGPDLWAKLLVLGASAGVRVGSAEGVGVLAVASAPVLQLPT